MPKVSSVLKKKLTRAKADIKKLQSAAELIQEKDPIIGAILSLHQLKSDPEAKFRLAVKVGIPAAGITGLLVGGSKGNREAMRSEEC